MMTEPPPLFTRVDQSVWRGAHPDAGSAEWLTREGVRAVINLELEHRDSDLFGPTVALVHLPDWEPVPVLSPGLEDWHVRQLLRAIAILAKPVYLHCRDGQNRTGVAVAAYRLIFRADPLDEVIRDFESFGALWAPADLAYLRGLADRRKSFFP